LKIANKLLISLLALLTLTTCSRDWNNPFDAEDSSPAGSFYVLSSDGDGDFMTTGLAPALQILGDVTVEAWVNINSIPETGFAQIVIQSANGELEKDNALFNLAITSDSKVDAFHESGAGLNHAVITQGTIPIRTWIHLAVVRDTNAKTYEIFINGLSDTKMGYSNNPTGGTSSEFKVSFGFDGLIDEVRIWRKTRTEAQIKATMSDTLGPQYYLRADSSLAGYWRFDPVENLGVGSDGLVDDIRDLSVNGNHGDLVGEAAILRLTSR